MTLPSDPPPPDEPPPPLPLTLELPAEAPRVTPAIVGVPERQKAGARRARGIAWRVVLTLVFVVGLAAGAAYVLLPRWVRDQVVATAADHGIALTVQGASFDAGGFRLTGLRASAADLPGTTAEAPELLVETQNLKLSRLTVRAAVLTLDGPWNRVDALLTRWRTGASGGMCSDCLPTEVDVEGSRVVWTHALPESGPIVANDVHVGSTFRGNGAEVHVSSSQVTLGVPGGDLGPWRVDVDRTPASSRVRIALDPAVPEASTVMIVGDAERTTHVDVVVPRSPVARLGLSPAVLGLPGKDVQLEASIHYSDLGGERAEASATGGVHGLQAPGVPRALDVTWEASAAGDPRKGMDVKRARLAAGPLVGALSGTVTTFDDGFRVDLGWLATPVPCQAFDTPLDSGQPFDVAYQLRRLADAAGLTKLSGQVSARGSATFDSRDLGSTRLSFVPDVSCQVALFAH